MSEETDMAPQENSTIWTSKNSCGIKSKYESIEKEVGAELKNWNQ
jgi:hypothetical protein